MIKNGWKGYKDDYRTNSISLYDPYIALGIDQNSIIAKIDQRVKEYYKDNIVYSHSFLRMYKNNSQLALHTDRKGLDVTLSVNIGGLESWPICISNVYTESDIDTYSSKKQNDELTFKNDHSVFLTPRGCGVACYGNNFPHWRDIFECRDDEYVLQIFYHWRIIS